MRYLGFPGICRNIDVGAANPKGVHAPADIFSHITGERGGKRFGPSETGRGWIGLTDLHYRIIRQRYQNLTPARFAAL
jgi:hypothetical protein